MSGHTPTPGPWAFRKPRPEDKELRIHGPDGLTLDYDDVDHEQQLADARLIAAAPDLLEVLENLRPKIQCYQAQTQAAPRKHCPCINCYDAKAADAAIAKARGK